MTAKRIAVFTSTRAEYGLLRPLMHEINASLILELQVIVSGTHLSSRHGMTCKEIESDGFNIDARVDMCLLGDSSLDISKSAALAMIGVAEALERLQPDALVLLGDRYEILAVAQAAVLARVPIVHVHGGETTEGAIDDLIRHAVTKLAHLHFPAAEPYAQRLRQMGESSESIWNVGALALDNISTLEVIPRPILENELGIILGPPSFLVTYHPVTTEDDSGLQAVEALLKALNELNATVVITGVNADPGSSVIKSTLEAFAASRMGKAVLVESLGAKRYLSLMHHVDAVVGNSSSGLLEAPAIGVTTVDIGDRQKGRLRAPSVIHCDEDYRSIREALELSLSNKQRQLSSGRKTYYGIPGAARRIVETLESVSLSRKKRPFFDIQLPDTQCVVQP